MVTPTEIDEAFDALESAFAELAEAEDKFTAFKNKLEDYKPDSEGAKSCRKKMRAMGPNLNKLTRKYRLAAMRVDRIKTLAQLNER